MSFDPRDYLHHILAEADYLISRSAGLSAEEFFKDDTLRRAFVRSLEVIGEATRHELAQGYALNSDLDRKLQNES